MILKFKLGQVHLSESNGNPEFQALDSLVTRTNDLSSSLATLEQKHDSLQFEHDALLREHAKWIQNARQREDEVFVKFAELLNAKKRKVLQLKRALEVSEMRGKGVGEQETIQVDSAPETMPQAMSKEPEKDDSEPELFVKRPRY